MRVRAIQEVDGLGWHPGSGVVFEHSKLGRIVHVAICKDDGTKLYDQPMHLEPVGAVTVPVNSKGELGIVEVERPTVRSAAEYRYPDLDLATLGVASLEFPRGFPKKGELGAQTAAREGEEELGSPIRSVRQVGEITPNTTFHPHRIPVFLVRVDERFAGTMPPDVNEKILKVRWISVNEFMRLIADGRVHCGMTKAAFCHYLVVRE